MQHVAPYCSVCEDLAKKQTPCQPGGNDIGCSQSPLAGDLREKKKQKNKHNW